MRSSQTLIQVFIRYGILNAVNFWAWEPESDKFLLIPAPLYRQSVIHTYPHTHT